MPIARSIFGLPSETLKTFCNSQDHTLSIKMYDSTTLCDRLHRMIKPKWYNGRRAHYCYSLLPVDRVGGCWSHPNINGADECWFRFLSWSSLAHDERTLQFVIV